jgi:hypothetical protein
LHLLNDANRGLHERHLVALAKVMNIPMAEVYEVATFYHHFEVIRDGDVAADLTIRVCNGLSCELAGASQLIAKLPQLLGNPKIKVIAAPLCRVVVSNHLLRLSIKTPWCMQQQSLCLLLLQRTKNGNHFQITKIWMPMLPMVVMNF